jgi:hypothetical protein
VFLFVARGCERFQNSRVHSSMNEESVIEKLHKIAKEKEAQKSEHRKT